MSVLNIFKRIDRKLWFVCHNCLQLNNHDAVRSIFYTESPSVIENGRPTMRCPRCNDANTRSFQDLQKDGSEAALWGLERLVKKHPRSQFEVKPGAKAADAN